MRRAQQWLQKLPHVVGRRGAAHSAAARPAARWLLAIYRE